MKKTFLIFITTILLTNCNNSKTNTLHANSNGEKLEFNSDSLKQIAEPKRNDTTQVIKSFTEFNNAFFDSLNQVFKNSKNIQTTIKEDIISGDTGISYKIMTDTTTKSTLYLFEWDCGENGDGEDQFYLINDSLICVRSFTHQVEEYPTDTSHTVWGNEEEIYLFSGALATIKERKNLTKGGNGSFNWIKEMSNIPFNAQTTNKDEIYKKKKDELTNLLNVKADE